MVTYYTQNIDQDKKNEKKKTDIIVKKRLFNTVHKYEVLNWRGGEGPSFQLQLMVDSTKKVKFIERCL